MLHAWLRRVASGPWGIAPLSVALGCALVGVGWLDYSSARRELSVLVRAQATSARDTVAAAARANRAAGTEARAQLAERLLDNARLIAEIDRRGPLSATALEEIASRNHLFRVTVLAADGTREHFIVPAGGGRGAGPGGGYNVGAGAGGALLVERLLNQGEREAVTDLHEGRRGGVARLAAGVRRANGGAVLLSVDATEVANLQKQSSLDALLADIVRSTEDVAYILFDDGGVLKSAGEVPPDVVPAAPDGPDAVETTERRLTVGGGPILEIASPIDIGAPRRASLTLGMRLNRLQQAERRTAIRLAISLASAAALGVLAIGLAWVRRQFGALSAEHALAQEALRRRDRLSAMGELASTVAHEIRNPLNAIGMSAQRLKKECLGSGQDPDDDARELVEVIQRETQRINGKVQQFLEYARPPALHRGIHDVGPWLSAIITAIKPVAESRHVRLEFENTAHAAAHIDAEQMRQAVDNLLLNAIDATPEGGTVILRAASTARELTLDVIDTGSGIDPGDLPKIFDLYFTTKRDGTGVGLAVTQQIVAAHGGTIEVESVRSRGTTMRIRVPVAGSVAHA